MIKLRKVSEGLSPFLREKGLDSFSLWLKYKLFGTQMCNHDLGSLLREEDNKMPQERSASFSRCLLAGQTHGHPQDLSEGLGRLSGAVVPKAKVRVAPCADGFPRWPPVLSRVHSSASGLGSGARVGGSCCSHSSAS